MYITYLPINKVILYIEFFIKYLHANDSSILLSINVTNIIDPHSKHIR